MEAAEMSLDEILEEKKTLQEQIETCEKLEAWYIAQKQFLEAGEAHKKLLELKSTLDERNQKKLKDRHDVESNEIEDSYQKEYDQFNEEWNSKLQEYRGQADITERNLLDKQAKELEEAIKSLEEKLPSEPKYSSKYLSMQRQQEGHVAKKEFDKAHKLQQQITVIQAEEMEKFELIRSNKLQKQIENTQKKQQIELAGTRKKLRAGFVEIKKEMQTELEKLSRRYQHMRKELSNQQRVETAGGNKSKPNMRRASGVYSRDKSELRNAPQDRRQSTADQVESPNKFAF